MSDQTQERRAKLQKMAEAGVDAYGSRFTRITKSADLRSAADRLGLEPGQISDSPDARFRSAGRLHLLRDTGKLIFATIRDWTGDIQWALSKKAIEDPGSAATTGAALPDAAALQAPPGEAPFPPGVAAWQAAKLLDLGDIVGAEGRLGRTKTGELTLWVDRFRVLSKAVRPPPEKWHGLTDVEQRYRKRYVDLLANPESQQKFITRARIIDYIRGVLRERGFIEVETPVLQPIYGGAAARPFTTHHNTLDMRLYLRISPELYLKRCLVGGLERVYEFARCFRNEGISPRHNPEFTMLELYQAYGDYHDMMDVTEAIVAGAARDVIGATKIRFGEREIDYATPWPRRRYADLVREYAGVDIHDRAAVRDVARKLGVIAKLKRSQTPGEGAAGGVPVQGAAGASPATCAPGGSAAAGATGDPDGINVDDSVLVNLVFEATVEQHLVNPTFVTDYPAPLCPLTKRRPDDPRFALRFECFINGMEMGNAYSELNDPVVQHATLAAQLRGEGDETMAVMDEDFVEALEYAMPPAGGLGIGIDRLCMLLTGSESIREVLLFPLQRTIT